MLYLFAYDNYMNKSNSPLNCLLFGGPTFDRQWQYCSENIASFGSLSSTSAHLVPCLSPLVRYHRDVIH